MLWVRSARLGFRRDWTNRDAKCSALRLERRCAHDTPIGLPTRPVAHTYSNQTRAWRPVFVAFVAVLLGLSNGAALYGGRKARAHVDGLMKNAIISIQLAERIERDIYQRRLLIGFHIIEKEAAGMDRLEKRIGDLRTDYREAANTYESLVMFPGEAAVWQKLKDDVDSLQAPLAETLALSRNNQDVDARNALVALEGSFAVIDGEVSAMLKLL